MSAANDRCRFCGGLVTVIVRTVGGASRVCDDHVDRIPNPVNVARLPGRAEFAAAERRPR